MPKVGQFSTPIDRQQGGGGIKPSKPELLGTLHQAPEWIFESELKT